MVHKGREVVLEKTEKTLRLYKEVAAKWATNPWISATRVVKQALGIEVSA